MSWATQSETRKACKAHRCSWCGEFIEAGTTYVGWTWFDPAPETVRVHHECNEAISDLPSGDTWEPWHYERGCTCAKGECEPKVCYRYVAEEVPPQ